MSSKEITSAVIFTLLTLVFFHETRAIGYCIQDWGIRDGKGRASVGAGYFVAVG